MDKKKIAEELNKHTKASIQQFLKEAGEKGYSKYNKPELIKYLMDDEELLFNFAKWLENEELIKLIKEGSKDEVGKKINPHIAEILEIFKKMVKDKSDKPVPYIMSSASTYMPRMNMLFVLKQTENDCSYSKTELVWYQRYDNVDRKDIVEIAKAYLRCKKRNKMLVFDIGLRRYDPVPDAHSNALIFNYHRNEIELFEPWGRGIKPFGGTKFVQDTKILAQRINNEIQKIDPSEPELKFITPYKVCPTKKLYRKYEDFQSRSIEGSKNKEKRYSKKFDMEITDPGGFCVAWSFFYLYLRLMFPSSSSDELYDTFNDVLEDDPVKFRNFIRGFSRYAYKTMKKIYNEMLGDKNAKILLKTLIIADNKDEFKKEDIKLMIQIVNLHLDREFEKLTS